MTRQRNPKGVIASGSGLLVAYPVWQWLRGLEEFQQLYANNSSQELIWTMAVLIIVASFVAGCIYIVLTWLENTLK